MTPAANPSALASAITALIDDDERRWAIAEAGHAMINDSFNWEKSTDILERAIRERIAEATASAD